MVATWSVERLDTSTVRVAVAGQFDMASEEAFVSSVDQLFNGGQQTLVQLDFAAVDFIDSSGVRAILRLCEGHRNAVTVVRPSEPVTRVLRIAGITDLISGDGTGAP
jgi:anti-anti-sigma factor